MPETLHHYLLTAEIFADIRLHAYLMCDDERDVQLAVERLGDQIDKLVGHSVPTVILQTKLSTDESTKIVRDFLRRTLPDTTNLDNAKHHHFCVWSMPTSDPNDEVLMKLH